MSHVNIHEANAQLSKLGEKAMLDEEVIIAKVNKPVAKLVAMQPKKEPRKPGSAKGEIWAAPDFEGPLEVLKEYIPCEPCLMLMLSCGGSRTRRLAQELTQ
jgi:antitoxin (DNA-binding transcriptional repressor) of toxin-antitoxin stability system